MHGYPHAHQITPPAMSAARKLLTAGQARADREIVQVDEMSARVGRGDLQKSLAFEAGAFRGVVRNLCAELAAFEPIDGSIEISWKGYPLHVHIQDELIQANGYDIAPLLSKEDRAAILYAAEEKQRDQAAAHAERVAYDAFAERAA